MACFQSLYGNQTGRAYFPTEAKISIFIQVEPKGEPPLSMFAGTQWPNMESGGCIPMNMTAGMVEHTSNPSTQKEEAGISIRLNTASLRLARTT